MGLTLLLAACHLLAQTSARQGDPVTQDRTHFRSPMVIDTVLLAVDRLLWKSEWFSFPAGRFAGYVCDNVRIDRLEMSAKERRDGNVRVRLRVTLSNAPGHDK